MFTDYWLSKLIPLAIRGFLYHLSLLKVILKEKSYTVNTKRVSRLMNVMGIQTIYPREKLGSRNPGHRLYHHHYLLKEMKDYGDAAAVVIELCRYLYFYNNEKHHWALVYKILGMDYFQNAVIK